jgi:hypothetical protein
MIQFGPVPLSVRLATHSREDEKRMP